MGLSPQRLPNPSKRARRKKRGPARAGMAARAYMDAEGRCTDADVARLLLWDQRYHDSDADEADVRGSHALAIEGGLDAPPAAPEAVEPGDRFTLYMRDGAGAGALLGYAQCVHELNPSDVHVSWFCAPGAGAACLDALVAFVEARCPAAARVTLCVSMPSPGDGRAVEAKLNLFMEHGRFRVAAATSAASGTVVYLERGLARAAAP